VINTARGAWLYYIGYSENDYEVVGCFRAEKQLGTAKKRIGWRFRYKDGARRCRPSGHSEGNERPKRKMMRTGGRDAAVPDENPGGGAHHHVGKASKVLRLIAFARQGVDKDARSVVSS